MEICIDQSLSIKKVSVSAKGLLTAYWLIPIAWGVVFIDLFLLHGAIQQKLPKIPEKFTLFLILFIAPHLLLSLFTFFDREYINSYKKSFLTPLVLFIATTIFLPQMIGNDLFYAFFMSWTVIHFIGQQFGLCAMIAKIKNIDFMVWKWSGVIIATLVYLDIYFEFSERFFLTNTIYYTTVFLFVFFTIANIRYSKKCIEPIGKTAVWLNYTLILTAWVLHDINYSFVVAFVGRAIHDLTALRFYIAHDVNRNAEKLHNFLYRSLASLGMPILILAPLLAMMGSIVYVQYRSFYLAEFIIIVLSMFHYYSESFIWKKGSLHRQAIIIN